MLEKNKVEFRQCLLMLVIRWQKCFIAFVNKAELNSAIQM